MKVELTSIELKALELKDINNYNDKKCAHIMNINIKEYNNILNRAREKNSNAKPGSIAAKANMVKEFNERNNK